MQSPVARRVVSVLAIVASGAGALISWDLALEYYRLPTESAGLLGAFCGAAADVFKNANCEKVSKSRWGWFPPLPAETKAPDKPAAGDQDKGKSDDTSAGGRGTDKAQDMVKPDASRQGSKDSHPGIPTGQLGLIYFSVVFCWLLFASPVRATRVWPHLVLLATAILGAAGSAMFEIIMFKQLDAWCPACLAAHVLSFVLLLFVLLLWPRQAASTASEPAAVPALSTAAAEGGLFAPLPEHRPEAAIESGWPTNSGLLTMLVIAVLLGAVEHFYILNVASHNKLDTAKLYHQYYEKKANQYDRYWQHNYWAWALSPKLEVPTEGRPALGPAEALHTLVIFSDFECPGCKQMAGYIRNNIIPMSQKGRGGGLKVVFKHWPLCKDCNEVMQGPTKHPNACQAAYAAEAARLLGGNDAFWKMHDLLFANQDEWKKTGNFSSYAKAMGLEEAAFVKAMGGSEALARVRQDVADGDQLGSNLSDLVLRAEAKVEGTPSLYIDGQKLNNPTKALTWKQILAVPPAGSSGTGTVPAASQPRRSVFDR